jgi:TP901 family phage tail tape measure protein
MAERNINIVVKAMDNARAGLNAVIGGLSRLRAHATSVFSFIRSAGSRLWHGIFNLPNLVMGSSVIVGLTNFVKAAADAEEGAAKLAQLIDLAGGNSERTVPRLKAFADEMQRLTKYENDEILALMAHARAQGVSSSRFEEMTKAAIGMASTYAVDLPTAFNTITAALKGFNRPFQQLTRIQLTGKTGAENYATIIDLMSKRFSVAEDEVTRTTGAFQRMINRLGDLREEIGTQIASGLGLVNMFSEAGDSADDFTARLTQNKAIENWLKRVKPELVEMGKLIGGLLDPATRTESLTKLTGQFMGMADVLGKKLVEYGKPIGASIADGIIEGIKGIGKRSSSFLNSEEFSKGLKGIGKRSSSFLNSEEFSKGLNRQRSIATGWVLPFSGASNFLNSEAFTGGLNRTMANVDPLYPLTQKIEQHLRKAVEK